MKSVKQLNELTAAVRGIVAAMQSTLATFFSESERVRADASRHPDYIAEKIGEARKRAMASFAGALKSTREIAATAHAEKPFWSHNMLVLSRQRFAPDLTADSAIRLSKLTELTAMPSGLLQAVFDNAKVELDWPLLYCSIIAGQTRMGEPGWKGTDVSDIKVPEQVEALDAIRACEQLAASAEHIIAQCSDTPISGAQKMQFAREMGVRPAPPQHAQQNEQATSADRLHRRLFSNV